MTIAVPLEKILSQLSRGSVKISFGELRVAAPEVFSQANDRDRVMVPLPLADILTRLNPALITRRRVQKQVEVPEDISSPFDPQHQGHIFSVGPANPNRSRRPDAASGCACGTHANSTGPKRDYFDSHSGSACGHAADSGNDPPFTRDARPANAGSTPEHAAAGSAEIPCLGRQDAVAESAESASRPAVGGIATAARRIDRSGRRVARGRAAGNRPGQPGRRALGCRSRWSSAD